MASKKKLKRQIKWLNEDLKCMADNAESQHEFWKKTWAERQNYASGLKGALMVVQSLREELDRERAHVRALINEMEKARKKRRSG